MTGPRVYIAGLGIVSPLGLNLVENEDALRADRSALRPATRFSKAHPTPLPVGEVPLGPETDPPSRTCRLARLAADQAMAACAEPPDAVVVGGTTGGMPESEILLRDQCRDSRRFDYHSVAIPAEDLARRFGCRGPVLTVSAACASGAAAIALAVQMLRSGGFRRVLAGGADALCRLTYYGFHSLQLIDPEGARPMDRDRRGMSVAEGAAMLLLSTEPADGIGVEIRGIGLSCDAHHPTTPHPEGDGAYAAMADAVADGGMAPDDIDYISLHGTGTLDNDRSEARAVKRLFPTPPPVSSIKGATGHSLAAAGAIEAVVSARAIRTGLIPANTGWRNPDPALDLAPVDQPHTAPVAAVLSNSFGFGGTNAALLFAATDAGDPRPQHPEPTDTGIGCWRRFRVLGSACVTGAGTTHTSVNRFMAAQDLAGVLSADALSEGLSPRVVRRLKRLPRMALGLAMAAHADAPESTSPGAVFFGTGWGALSETNDFLSQLFDSDERFASPTDFIGSVHNAAAGQIALGFQARGANITACGGDYSFEEALAAAGLLATGDTPVLVAAADEYHDALSPLFDPSVDPAGVPADGGGAISLVPSDAGDGIGLTLRFFQTGRENPGVMSDLVQSFGSSAEIHARYGAVFAGIPRADRAAGDAQLAAFLSKSRYSGPVIDTRQWTGEYAAASATAAVLAVRCVAANAVPDPNGTPRSLEKRGILVLGLGRRVTAMEVLPS